MAIDPLISSQALHEPTAKESMVATPQAAVTYREALASEILDLKSDTNANILLFSFIGDALALGTHWIYDQDKIGSQFGRVTSHHDPISRYHPGNSAGKFTHYGDQALLLLRSVAEDGKFDFIHPSATGMAFRIGRSRGNHQSYPPICLSKK